jgi:predicted transport protein
MDKLLACIERIRSRLDGLRHHGLKEMPTRTIVIDPILEALGWDIRDPDEVELEAPTIDGRSVDYALKLNRRPVLLVEAKPLDDPLDDVKAAAQIVRYGAAEGIVWCILTNGVRWKVYRSIEECSAPEKLMFEVSLDPKDASGATAAQLGQQMWRFSREEMARGTLDALGEQVFTDGKVRKALDTLMRDAPRKFLNLVHATLQDKTISPQRIKESLRRLCQKLTLEAGSLDPSGFERAAGRATAATSRSEAAKKAWITRRGKPPRTLYNEEHHTADKPQEVLALYRAIDRECLGLRPGAVQKRYLAKYISYEADGRSFCSVLLRQGGLRVWLHLKHHRLAHPPSFARDVSNVGHWGSGDLVELAITSLAEIEEAAKLIRASFQERCGQFA